MEDALRFASDSGDGSGKEKKKKIGVLATFAPTITSITKELEELMATTGTSVEIVTRHNDSCSRSDSTIWTQSWILYELLLK